MSSLLATPAKEPFPWDWCLHDRAGLGSECTNGYLLLEVESQIPQRLQLSKDPFLRGVSEKQYIVKEHFHDISVVLQALFCQEDPAYK
jgi:hypothetical protein